MENQQAIKKLKIKDVQVYVQYLLENNLPASTYFHNYGHTLVMKKEAIALAKASGLSKEKQEILALASLFHNTGLTKSYNGSQEESQVIAAKYLTDQKYPREKINKVLPLLKIPFANETPVTLMEKIIHDSYYAYFGLKKYKTRSERLRKEKEENIADYTPDDKSWQEESFQAIQQHHFLTQAAIQRYAEREKSNIAKAKKRILAESKKEAKRFEKFSIADNKAAITMFKTALRNHIDLTSIADQKSNIMLSVSALLLTIGLPMFASHLSNRIYFIPATVFMLTCIITMVFATLSTRPIKMDGNTNLDRINSGKTNLFFFGNFYKIGLEPYTEAIKKVITNKEQLDTSIINDLYYLGHSLGNKFHYLRLCYNVFISGICLSLIAFILTYLLTS